MRNLLKRKPKEQPKDEVPEAVAVAPVQTSASVVMEGPTEQVPSVCYGDSVECSPLEGMKRSPELDIACQALVREVVKERGFEHVEVWRLVDGSILIRRKETR